MILNLLVFPSDKKQYDAAMNEDKSTSWYLSIVGVKMFSCYWFLLHKHYASFKTERNVFLKDCN